MTSVVDELRAAADRAAALAIRRRLAELAGPAGDLGPVIASKPIAAARGAAAAVVAAKLGYRPVRLQLQRVDGCGWQARLATEPAVSIAELARDLRGRVALLALLAGDVAVLRLLIGHGAPACAVDAAVAVGLEGARLIDCRPPVALCAWLGAVEHVLIAEFRRLAAVRDALLARDVLEGGDLWPLPRRDPGFARRLHRRAAELSRSPRCLALEGVRHEKPY